jgi:membrane associated rhomboid family serine protease
MRRIEMVNERGRPLVALYGSDRKDSRTFQTPQVAEEPAEREPVPYVTYILTGINVVIFLLMMAVGHGNIGSVAEMFGAKVNGLIQQGQWWRLLTPIFLHGSLFHLLSNSLSLVWFGSGIERLYGARKYLLLYLIAGVAGNIASYYHMLGMSGLSLGASGAIFGLVGAGLMFPIRFRALLPKDAPSRILGQILPIAAINLFIGFTTPSIDNWAHMGGLAGGAILALFLIPDALTEREPGRVSTAVLSTACVAVALITLLAGFKQWQWARNNLPMNTYRIGAGDDLWWHIGIPLDWKPISGSQAWAGPKGTRLDIVDSLEDPRLLEDVQKTSEQVQPNIKVDGHPGWQIRAKIGSETSDLFLVPIYGRVEEFLFHPSDYANTQYVNTVNQILRSVHFDHEPQPAPQPVPQPSSAP